jgi:UDP-N-acetylmuramate--alanine ligase
MNGNQSKRIFFSGIGGSGMSAIASFMAAKGHLIAGSDRSFDTNRNHPVYRILCNDGITIVPQDGKGIDHSFDLAVFSTAVEPDQPEVIRAIALGVPVTTRPEYLAALVSSFRTIAVAGTSGKSTTSGMLAFLMNRLGLEPNFIGGGRVKQFRSERNPGNSLTGRSDYLVIEACESDGTIVHYRPVHTIILNLDLDHHAIDVTGEMFRTLMKNTSGRIVVNADDGNLAMIEGTEAAVFFSMHKPSPYQATDIVPRDFGTEFSLRGVRFHLAIPGLYNLSNSLACIAMLAEIGVPLDEIAAVLQEFRGIERRFDIHLDDGTHLVIDDYAHNPHKISSLMATMKSLRDGICYIFQPHGFAPTKMMKQEYIAAFAENLRESDHLILLPIFYAGGTVHRDISSHDLAAGIRSLGKSVEVLGERNSIHERLHKWNTFIVLGARDETIADFAREIAQSISPRNQLHTDRTGG